MDRPQSGSTAETPDLEPVLSFLADPASYPDHPLDVQRIETRMSWVFLTSRFVYKMKKPVALPYLDFTTLEKRRANCLEEDRLNKRLAPQVYLGVVPVTRARDGQLTLNGDGQAVEWLVRMRRLPRQMMLDQAVLEGRVVTPDLQRCARVLVDFYQQCPPAIQQPEQYLRKLTDAIQQDLSGLAHPSFSLDPAVFRPTVESLLECLHSQKGWFEERVHKGLVVEGHGDLRPEHVCLSRPPVFIDCLEFSRELRIIDIADELAYLFLECECLGASEVGAILAEAYRQYSSDPLPDHLLAFYKARRALLRAKLCLAHVPGQLSRERSEHWRERADDYLARAARHAAGVR